MTAINLLIDIPPFASVFPGRSVIIRINYLPGIRIEVPFFFEQFIYSLLRRNIGDSGDFQVIVRILLNVCHNIQKERKRMVPTADFPDREMPVYSDAVEFRDCLFQLEERERMPVVLYYIEGYTIQQVASILRIPQGTVKSRLDRGRRQLRDICREEVFEV